MPGHLTVRLREMNPIRVERGAERATRIARRRGHIDIVESGLAENARVGDAVERDAAAVTEIAQSSLALQRGSQIDEDLLEHALHARGDVGVARALQRLQIDRLPRIARRPQRVAQFLRIAPLRRGVEIEVAQVEREAAVGGPPRDAAHHVGERRFSVRGEPHHLVLAFVDGKPEVRGERRIEHPQRVREAELAQHLDRGHAAVAHRAAPERKRGPFADAVGGEDRRRARRRSEKCSRSV